jgi:hypothetical protein
MRIIIEGTRTAGETAPKQNPFAKHRDQGNWKSHLDNIATTVASTI